MQVWIMAGLWNNIQQIVSDNSLEAKSIFLLLQRFTLELAACMASLLWSLWKHHYLKV